MITVSLYHKYRTALDDIAQDSADRQHITTNAANLALLLAMQELDAAWRKRCLPAQAEPTQNRQQIERINAWLREHAPDDFWTDDDTATSIIAYADRLRGTVEGLRQDLATAIDERNAADGEVASLEAEVARLTTAYNDVNGELAKAIRHAEGVEAAQAATVQPVEAALVVGDDPELADYIIGLDAGRHTWRTIPKPVRWRLVCSVLRSIWRDGKLPTMDDFDKHAPAWMPTANACATTFGDGKWTVMCGKAIEP